MEFTPIREWLEIELVVSKYYSKSSSDLNLDLIFKKPYTVSQNAEFMFGLGPEISSTRLNRVTSYVWGSQIVLDLMYWPFKIRRFGFYVEPAYDFSFGAGNEKSIGFNGRLLFGFK